MGGIARERRQETREEQEEEGWYLLLVVLCDSIVQSLEAPVILHLWVRLALCKQLHQAEAAITCCQHQGSPVHSVTQTHAHTQVQSLDVGVTYRPWPSVALTSAPSLMREEAIL